jgi:hypothetical protein
MQTYIVIQADKHTELVHKVNKRINEGYVLYENIIYAQNCFYQPMVKLKEEK